MMFLEFWGKARPPADRPQPSWHPIAYHLLDVAAVMDSILEARPIALQRAAQLLRLSEPDAQKLLVMLASLHDLGKFAPAFQAQVPELWNALRTKLSFSDPLPGRHTEDGYALWVGGMQDSLGERIWLGGQRALDALAPAIFGHHGRPVLYLDRRYRQAFPAQALAAANECAEKMVALLCPQPIGAPAPRITDCRIASWYVAGLMTTADWIGSRTTWFPYTAPFAEDANLDQYWLIAREAADRAVREAGILAPVPAPPRSFRGVTGMDRDPTPLQRWAESITLSETPWLVVVEDVTGSGKTEAAQLLVHRLLTAGRISGAYWAMPTQATANAMYNRQASMLQGLFAEASNPRPSLVLAHSQQRLHQAFRDTVLNGTSPSHVTLEPASTEETEDEVPSTVGCASFLADDRRAALLADVGAGTIDQALLGVLPSRFNSVRLFGLADKVLVVDEAHAYDAYMGTELQAMLRFQAALGGYAVVLSATLPQSNRAELANAWLEGLQLGGWCGAPAISVSIDTLSSAYPLVTGISGDSVCEWDLEAAEWSNRSIAVRWLHEPDDAIDHAATMAAAGAAVAWVRNTVDDCLAAADELRRRGAAKVIVFHARFAQCDRQAREAEVLKRFGKGAPASHRAGWVLVATQVVEQSLDLDFDVMLSDLAPVDLLVQRAGRLWRHVERDSQRPPGCVQELVVLAPARDSNPREDWLGGTFRGTAAVYRNYGVLWRTVEALDDAGKIETPDGLRALIEAVYQSDGVPDALLRAAQRAEAKDLSGVSTAKYGTLKVQHGYDGTDQPWVDDLHVPTRLGDETTTVRLARVLPDHRLAPWADARPVWRAWALSEVRVRANRVPPGSLPTADHHRAAEAARGEWGRFEQEIPILPLEPLSGELQGGRIVDIRKNRVITVSYSTDFGLVFTDEP